MSFMRTMKDSMAENEDRNVLHKVDERHFGQAAGSKCPSYVKNQQHY
jgi:hypothetical protein